MFFNLHNLNIFVCLPAVPCQTVSRFCKSVGSLTMRKRLNVLCLIVYVSHISFIHAFLTKYNSKIFHDRSITKHSSDRQFFSPQTPPLSTFHKNNDGFPKKALLMQPLVNRGIQLSNLLYDSTETAFNAWGWTSNLGAPSALVGGAVLVSLSETRDKMTPKQFEKDWIRTLKLIYRFLLLSSFALEVVCIFVSTITGSVLLGHGARTSAKSMIGYTTPLGLLNHHHEFEYLTIQISFLQGLIHWLVAVAIDLLIPQNNEKTSSRRMNLFLSSSLGTLISWILAFYNNNLTFYTDYFQMLGIFTSLFLKRYITWPIRPMSIFYIPGFCVSLVLGWRAFNCPPELDLVVHD